MIGPTPLLDFFKRGEVARDVRLTAAQGALAPKAHEQLAILVLLLEDSDAEIAVHRHDDRGVYAATLDDREIATVRYELDGDRLVLITTTVEPEFRGRGIATELIADALDDLRERGTRITVLCPVVSAFIANNPAYADLADARHPDA